MINSVKNFEIRNNLLPQLAVYPLRTAVVRSFPSQALTDLDALSKSLFLQVKKVYFRFLNNDSKCYPMQLEIYSWLFQNSLVLVHIRVRNVSNRNFTEL